MIRVERAPEPANFDESVRRPGLAAISEMVGDLDLVPKRRGRKRKKLASSREKLKGDDFPDFWTRALPHLKSGYSQICAYTGLYIHCGSGKADVDHFIPKSWQWKEVYEWSNYRLSSWLVNSIKSEKLGILDPFEVEDDWFELEFVFFQVNPQENLPRQIASLVESTIGALELNRPEFCKAREEYVAVYQSGDISDERLRNCAPFIHREMVRQGKLGLRPPD